ncbi:lytic murein transglycosylase [Alteromonas sp. ASW11-36]|uniref:Lytic murein transglycosylase n=1 Tax=Alteromonas arenosi TaxID=3055817 RepID=A0ABT7SVR6_9ALTE|nr:lytic murein transglycosylase [Alteromonas sp. ASW11-36]MDM7860291.1 lytic murein transglycosylase [Alteromonas sp. ASW11-36]
MVRFISIALFVLTAVTVHANEQQQAFDAYVQGLKSEALSQGYSETFLEPAFATIKMRERVITRDRNQPERKITLTEYLQTRVPDWKVKQAVELLNKHFELLEAVERQFGVQKRFIVALWGNESNFGRIQGKVPVLSALATLAFEGRREALFRKQFFDALAILKAGHVELDSFTGSWAGAMGQSQFLPSSFLTYAVDFDGDGKTDIWRSTADVFASIANYLASEGWNGTQTWGRQVSLLDPELSRLASLNRQAAKDLSDWQTLGIRRFDGRDLPQVTMTANLVMPDGAQGRAYLVYNNFQTLMKWNRSSYFGISVAYLSERIKKGS